MAEFPAMPLWTDAYLADTSHLTTIEHGAYLLLLMVAWRSHDKRLPDDDRKLARYARVTQGQWARLRPVLQEFFKVKDGYWTQGRLTDEAEAVRQHRERQSKAGKASALKRKGRHLTAVEPKGNQTATPYSYSTPKEDTNVSSPPLPPRGVQKPADVSDEVWADWKRVRKKPITATVLRRMETEAAKVGWTLAQAINEAAESGWQGFKAEYLKGHSNGRTGDDRKDGVAKALDRRLGLGQPAGEAGRRDDEGFARDTLFSPPRLADLR